MLYDEGKSVQITESLLVQLRGKIIGCLVERGDEQDLWWDLVNFDKNRVYLPDDVLSNVVQKKSIREIGKFLDRHFDVD